MTQPSAATSDQPSAHISYEWDADHGVFVATWYGVMTDDFLLEQYERYYAAPDYDPTCRELADTRFLTRNELTTDGLKRMARLAQRYQRSGLTALLANEDLSFGLGRMYNVFGPDASRRTEVFRDLPSALRWLGVEGDTLNGLATAADA